MLGGYETSLIDGVRVDHESDVDDAGVAIDRFRLTAERDIAGLATGRFDRPTVALRWKAADLPTDIEFCGFAFTQFALPVVGGADLEFVWAPSDGVRSPRAVLPLIARSAGEIVLLAPLVAAHEQVIAMRDGEIAWGWHGDLDVVPAGFTTEAARYRGSSVAEVLAAWQRDLGPAPSRAGDDPLLTHLSYWTDNGAAYWYRTERGRTIVDSVVDTVTSLRTDHGLSIGSVELDSWWYDHESPRPITEVGYPEEVPPSGTMTWAPRLDAFGASLGERDDLLAATRVRLGDVPLVLHARHISPRSPYVIDGVAAGEEWWASGPAAHPADPAFFRRWFDFAAANGVCLIEQDWMLMIWFGVPEMRAGPGRALAGQRAMNDHANATGVDLMWCMATPADLIEARALDRVVAVRTSDDYRFADDPALLWTWFLTANRLAGSLGLRVFKDVFFSNPDVGPAEDAIDGDPHAELEAALAALSGGPVGIGDRLGRTAAEIVRRTCDDDGRLRRVDGPIACTDDSMFGGPARGDGLAWATTSATTTDGTWTYVLAINTAAEPRTISDRYDLGDDRAVYDWRRGSWSTHGSIEVELASRDWHLSVVAPSGFDEAVAADVIDGDRYVVVEADLG